MPINVLENKSNLLLPWIMWGVATVFYFSQFAARVSIGIMAPALLRDLSTNHLGLGLVSASFYYACIPMLIFAGIFVDHFDIKKITLISLALIFLGCIAFSLSHSIFLGIISRFIMGAGGSFSFVVAAKLASLWFSKNRFGFLICTTQAIGMLGAVGGLVPVAFLFVHTNWRLTMIYIGFVFFFLIILAVIFIKDRPFKGDSEDISNKTKCIFLESLLFTIKNNLNWLVALYVGLMCAPIIAFGELWGVGFFKYIHHVSAPVAATLTSMLFIGYAIGAPLFGWLSDRLNNKIDLMFYSSVLDLILFFILIYSPFDSYLFLISCALLFGLMNSGSSLSYSLVMDFNPDKFVGTVIAFVGMIALLTGAILQPIVGFFIDIAHHQSLFGYRLSMSILIFDIFVAIMIIWLLKKEKDCLDKDGRFLIL